MRDGEGKKILVVDDSSTMRMLLCMTIKKVLPGMSITEAVDGIDAQTKLNSRPIDLVITDIVMPRMGGFELVAWIKESLSGDLPIIMVTTHGEEDAIAKGESLGVDKYLTKPVDGTELKKAVAALLGMER